MKGKLFETFEDALALVREIIESCSPELLVGYQENDYFDIKSQMYDFGNTKDRFDIAEDVAAFANASGGILAIGYSETEVEDSRFNICSGMASVLVRTDIIAKTRGVLRELIYPIGYIDSLEILAITLDATVTPVLFIVCPRADEGHQPIIRVDKSQDVHNKVSLIIYERIEDNSSPRYSAERLHGILKRGLSTQVTRSDFDSLKEEIIQSMSNIPLQTAQPDLKSKSDPIFDKVHTSQAVDTVSLGVYALPLKMVTLNLSNASLVEALSQYDRFYSIPYQRGAWNLKFNEKLKYVVTSSGKSLEIEHDYLGIIIRIFNDGRILILVKNIERYLGHATWAADYWQINTIAMVEFMLHAAALICYVFEVSGYRGDIQVGVDFHNPYYETNALIITNRHSEHVFGSPFNVKEYGKKNLMCSIDEYPVIDGSNPRALAYQILEDIYRQIDLLPVPYKCPEKNEICVRGEKG